MKFNRFIFINKVHLKALIVLFILINTPFHSKAQCPTPYASNVTSSCNQNVTITAVSTMGGVSQVVHNGLRRKLYDSQNIRMFK